ncbi:MAG: hypothetical protein WCK67_06160 [bacterium]
MGINFNFNLPNSNTIRSTNVQNINPASTLGSVNIPGIIADTFEKIETPLKGVKHGLNVPRIAMEAIADLSTSPLGPISPVIKTLSYLVSSTKEIAPIKNALADKIENTAIGKNIPMIKNMVATTKREMPAILTPLDHGAKVARYAVNLVENIAVAGNNPVEAALKTFNIVAYGLNTTHHSTEVAKATINNNAVSNAVKKVVNAEPVQKLLNTPMAKNTPAFLEGSSYIGKAGRHFIGFLTSGAVFLAGITSANAPTIISSGLVTGSCALTAGIEFVTGSQKIKELVAKGAKQAIKIG